MIGRLRGLLVARRSEAVIIDVHGAGYEVVMTPRDVSALPGVGEEVVVHTHLYVREDLMVLYGFAAEPARDLFRVLIGTSGVGPKVAMAMLASYRPDELHMAIATEDVDALSAVPGIGKRSAQKLILELRPKLADLDAETAVAGGGGAPAAAQLREALEGLGYSSTEIRDVLGAVPADAPVQEQLRHALQALGRR
jgi:Holliday junction DNA helicase RuvA